MYKTRNGYRIKKKSELKKQTNMNQTHIDNFQKDEKLKAIRI